MPDLSTTPVSATELPPAAGTGPTPEQVAAVVRAAANDEGERYPCLLGVYCDRCEADWQGDFIVHTGMTQADRFAVVRGHLVKHEGWQCDATGDLCPACRPLVFDLDVPMVVQLKTSVRPLTQNDHIHWRRKAKLVKRIREATYWAAKAAKIPTATHLTVTLHFAPGDKPSVTDAPNLTATSKPAIDGLTDAGLVPNDTDRYVTERMPVIHPGPGPRRLWLTVEVQR
jgi:crossover junction endodeoxyribonuclease RusA